MSTPYPPVPQIFGARPSFRYSAPWSECRIIHEHDCMGTRLLVVGDPDCGGYEWVIITQGKLESHSNDGYGISEVALRDGLIAAFKDCFGPPINSTTAEEPQDSRLPLEPALPTHPQAASPAHPPVSDAPATVKSTAEEHGAEPGRSAETPTTPAAVSLTQASGLAAPRTNTGHPPHHAAASPMLQSSPGSPHQGTPADSSKPEAGAPSLSAPAAKIHSSTQPSEAAAAPQLIQVIDVCRSVELALRTLSYATMPQRTAAALYLGLRQPDPDELTDAITRRTRARLLKAA